ncbi:MAG: SDR family oxidoreductase [Anaerolineales bacterium]|nr:SDR family oxidoreductase [Anaerolineales bacterium]
MAAIASFCYTVGHGWEKLQGQVAVITGAGRGIGAATAARLAAAGARLVLAARSEDEIGAVGEMLRKQGASVIAVQADVSDAASAEEVMEAALEEFDRVDILVNNAGIIWPLEEVADVDPEEWLYNILVNLGGPLLFTRNILPLMLDQGYGRIVNVSSHGAITPIAGASAYCAAKAGLDMVTRASRWKWRAGGITVNGFYPGMVDTAMQEDIRSVDTSESRFDTSYYHDAHARGELLPASLSADLVYWLVGPWSRSHNGEIFRVEDEAWRERVRSDLA